MSVGVLWEMPTRRRGIEMKRLACVIPVMALLIGLAAQPAGAALVLNLGIGNPAISGFPGPYGTATIMRIDATHASITFNSNIVGGNIYLFGDGGSVAVNVNAASWTLGSITGSNAGVGFTPGPYSDGGSGNEDGFGSFNQTINSFDGFSHSADTVSFSLTNNSGTWATDSDVLTANGSGYLVGAHIFVTSFPANAANGAIVTGFAVNGNVTPEPTAVVLLGLGLASTGMGFIRRRPRK